jgi:hypothetical protein
VAFDWLIALISFFLLSNASQPRFCVMLAAAEQIAFLGTDISIKKNYAFKKKVVTSSTRRRLYPTHVSNACIQ